MTGPRTLTVLVGTLPVEDGQTAPPVVGKVGHYRLLFAEAEHDEPDATIGTVRARAEPLGDGAPSRGGLMWDGTSHDEPPSWRIMLHGNGWTALWSAPRPVVGEVEPLPVCPRPHPRSRGSPFATIVVDTYIKFVSEKQRLSASVDADMIEAGRQAVATGLAESMSGWVNAALRRQSEHDERLRAADRFIAAYEAEHGVITSEDMERAEREMRERAIVVRGGQVHRPA